MKSTVSAIIFASIMSITAGETNATITSLPSTASVPVSAPTSTCTGSTAGWADVDGDGCAWYEQNDLPGCPYYGDYAGYDANTGEPIIGESGSVANDNCCHCFGTAAPALPIPMNFPTFSPTASQSPTAPTPKPTSPCTGNTPNWTDSYGDDCTWYEQWEAPGCPTWGMDEGEMGSAMDNCCFCKMG